MGENYFIKEARARGWDLTDEYIASMKREATSRGLSPEDLAEAEARVLEGTTPASIDILMQFQQSVDKTRTAGLN